MDTKNTQNPLLFQQTGNIFSEYTRINTPASMHRCHYHSTYEIYYLYSGERFYFIQDKMYHIKKGDIVLISPNIMHATFNAKEAAYERFLVSFKDEDIQAFSDIFPDIDFLKPFKQSIFVLRPTPHEQLVIETLLHKMQNTSKETKKLFFLTQLLFITCTLKSDAEEGNTDYISNTQKVITEVMAYINNNFSQELTLDTISEMFYIDSCYLSRIFKKTVGISFVDYINNVRIMEAKKQLKETDESILSIAESVGFKSNTHFGRIFKKITGTSPLQYRKLQK